MGIFFTAPAAQADWTPAKRLTWTSGDCYIPAIATGPGSAVHVVWRNNASGNSEIYYKRSTDGGATWQAARRLTWNPGDSNSPDVAADSGNAVHVVWRDDTPGNNEIYYRRSTDGGVTWQAAKRLTSTSGDGDCPAITTDSDGTIQLAWSDDKSGDIEIYHVRSTDSGSTWSSAKRLTRTTAWKNAPDIALDSDSGVHVVWYAMTSDNAEIFYRESPDGGSTWNSLKRLTWTSADTYYPTLSIDSNDGLHVVYEEYTPGNYDIFYKRSTDGGASWSAPTRLTWTIGAFLIPSMGTNSGTGVHVVWHDEASDNLEIYYKRSADSGMSWGPIQRLTWTSGSSYDPAIAIDSGDNIHVVWRDHTPGNYEIYYKKGT
jgi:hypothetical protein